MLTALLPPSEGQAYVRGFDIQKYPLEVKRCIGVVPEGLSLYERLTASEQVELVGRLHGLDRAEIERRIPPLLDMLELEDAVDKMIIDYSHGMRKKTALAWLVVTPPILWLVFLPYFLWKPGLIISLPLGLIVSLGFYGFTFEPLAHLLQKRESSILRAVVFDE